MTTYSWASCCSVARNFKLSTSLTGLKADCVLSCMAANVTWSWNIGDSCHLHKFVGRRGERRADLKPLFLVLGGCALVDPTSEGKILVPDLTNFHQDFINCEGVHADL